MLGNNPAVLADYDTVRIAWISTGRPTALAATEYLLLSKCTRQVLEIEVGTAWKPSKRPA
jgi:hypothetical protein